jgi:hypothetical protein
MDKIKDETDGEYTKYMKDMRVRLKKLNEKSIKELERVYPNAGSFH